MPTLPRSFFCRLLRGMIFGIFLMLSACEGVPPDVLVVYSAGPRPLAEIVCRNFSEKTGMPVELFTATTGQILAKLEAEKYRPRADVVVLAGNLSAEALKQQGMLASYLPKNIAETIDPEWHDPEGYYHSTGAVGLCLAFREDSFQDGLSWDSVLSDGIAGKYVMPSPTRSGSAADFLLTYLQNKPDQSIDTFLQARKVGMEIIGANNQVLTSLLIGAHNMVFAAADYLVYARIAAGEKLIVSYPQEGVPLSHRPVGILATTQKVSASEEFVDLYFSKEIQESVAAMHLLPSLKSVAVSPERAKIPLPPILPLDRPAGLLQQRKLLRQFQYEVERALIDS